jgi:hypothetical protein
MPSLPAWVALRAASLKFEQQPDKATGKYRKTPTLPAHLMLTPIERVEIERHVSALEGLLRKTPASDAEAEQDTLRAVTNMMLVLPSPTQNELSVEARGEAFMDALEDIPPWAVRSAIRRWNRGDCAQNERGQSYDYHWCPAPAELRRISWTEMHHLGVRTEALRGLLCAEALIEFSDEHCREMRARLAALFRNFGTPLVGKDGSGGAAGDEPAEGAHCGTQPKHSPA